jgi:hypothetical protein
MDESVNEDRVDFDMPSRVKYFAITDLDDLQGGGEARIGNLRVITSAPMSPSPTRETVWSPKSLMCGSAGIVEEELNDVIETFVNTLSDDSVETSGDEAHGGSLSLSEYDSMVTLTPKSSTGNHEATFESVVHSLSDDSIESRDEETQRRPISVKTTTPKKMLTPKSPTGNQEVTFESNRTTFPLKKFSVRMLTPKSPTGNQEVSFERSHPLETSAGFIDDVNVSNDDPGCVSDFVESSLSCGSPRANTDQARCSLAEARELHPIVETFESNKSDSMRILTPKSSTGNQEVSFERSHPLETSAGLIDDVTESNDDPGCVSNFVETSLSCGTPRANTDRARCSLAEARELHSIVETFESNNSLFLRSYDSIRLLTPKSPTGNQEVTFESVVHSLSDDWIESRDEETQRRPISVKTTTPKKKLYVRMLTPKSPTGNQEVTFESNQTTFPLKKFSVRMLTPKSPTGNQEVSFERSHPLETSVGLIDDVTESNDDPGCVSDFVETSPSCESPNNMIVTKNHPVMMSASPRVAGAKTKTPSFSGGAHRADDADAQDCKERKPAIGSDGKVVWDVNSIREAMKKDVPMATCETFQQDKIYSTRKAIKRADALVEIPLEEAFWVPEKNIPRNRRLEYSRQRAALLQEIRKEKASLRREQARTLNVDTVLDVLDDLCFIDDKNVTTGDVFELAANLGLLVVTLGRGGRMEGEMPAPSSEPQQSVRQSNESEVRAFKRLMKNRLSSRARYQSKPVPRQPVLVQAVRDLCFIGPSERLVRFEKTLLLETKAEGMKGNAVGRINNLKEDDSPVPPLAQHDDPNETTEIDHEYEKQIADYLARHSANESTAEPNPESHNDQDDKVEELVNAALNKREFSKDAKEKLKPFTRVMSKSFRSSYSKHKFGPNAEIVKAVRDLVFLDSERSIGYEGNTLLSETHAKGTKLLAADVEPKKSNSLGETRDPDVEIDEGYDVNDQDIALRDLFFLDWCEGYYTENEETSLTNEPNANGSQPLALGIDLRDETRSTDDARVLNEQGQREINLVSQDSESIGYEGNALAAELHAKRPLNIQSRKRHSSRSEDSDEVYDGNEIDLAFLDILVESHQTATKLIADEIKSRKTQSLDEKRDAGIEVNARYEVDEGGTVFSDGDESAITCSSDNAVAAEALPIVPASDENRIITSDEDVDIMFQAGLFAFNDIIVDGGLEYKIDRKLMARVDEDNELIPASKEFLPLYHVLKAMIAEHQDQGGSAPSPGMVDACQSCVPLEVMQVLQEWISSKCFSPK